MRVIRSQARQGVSVCPSVRAENRSLAGCGIDGQTVRIVSKSGEAKEGSPARTRVSQTFPIAVCGLYTHWREPGTRVERSKVGQQQPTEPKRTGAVRVASVGSARWYDSSIALQQLQRCLGST